MMPRGQRQGRGVASDTPVRERVVRRHRPDYYIILNMGLLMLLGLIVMYAIGPQRANVLNVAYATDYYADTYFIIKQGVSLLLALGAFVFMATVPYAWLQKHAAKALWFGFGACLLLYITGNILHIESIAQCTLGACRWFDLGPIGSLQPAEFLKFGLLLFMAGFLGMRAQQGLINDRDKTLIPMAAVVVAAMIFVVIAQRDLGTGIAMGSIIACMLFAGGIRARTGLILAVIVLAAGVFFIATADHRRERVMTYLQGDNTSTSDADNYHITHAKIALGTGGLLGLGIGNSIQSTGYLPEAINDSVFAIMGETFGFVGLAVILTIFTLLLLRILRTLDYLVDMRMKLLAAGVFGWFGSHVILNIAAMTGVAPLTGITLPLLSFGGTSMIFIAAALGLVFQLSRYTAHESTRKEVSYESLSSRRGVGRPRYAGRGGH